MSNKFKVKKKVISIALALVLAAQPLCAFPMNVFAGTGKNGVIKAPTVAANFELAKIIELRNGEKFDVNDHVKIIKPQGATVSYNVESQTVFSGSGNLLDADGVVQNPGIAKVKVTVGGASKETYVIADINAMLKFPDQNFRVSGSSAANEANSAAASVVNSSVLDGLYVAARVARAFAHAASNASSAAAEAAAEAAGNAEAAANAAAGDAAKYNAWCASYKNAVDGFVSSIVSDYKVKTSTKDKDWLNGAYAAVKAAKKLTDGQGFDLEAKLKIAYMAYKIAQFAWIYDTTDADKEAKASECKERADALQEVIDSLYSDKVGDIEAQG